ncbi:hypothetical protein THAOC_00201 [Thalassiosira oceanica]|uniref:Reverse transcriptase Ty1/copia-type domain-containing protein n=1 Tax=Thalassiosira oceanica TaxID=159749 RepID=K0TRK0_THAOC|nr:hypothetical protein THAOC_00201 [Thalassiosira oceanica]|eukprot:EJK77932.1 hypothetical protein THAOC_00201 [Thalassiosira oceanica]
MRDAFVPVHAESLSSEDHGRFEAEYLAELMVAAAPEVYRDYVTLWGDLSSQGFEINPYDPCVANKKNNGHQMTVCWYVDDLFMSHMDRGAVKDFVQWLSMEKFTRETIEEFPEPTEEIAEDPASPPNLFETREPILLNEDQAQIFHRITAKLLFLCAQPRCRRDIRTAVAFLTTG